MENEKELKEKAYWTAKAASLQTQVDALKENNIKKQSMLEELYEVIYHKGAWLTLSDENIEGMKKTVDKIKKASQQEPVEANEVLKSLELEETWGI